MYRSNSFSISRFSDLSYHTCTINTSEHGDVITDSTDQLISFCPRSLSLLSRVGSSRMVEGCVMLADISGFTKLSSELCSQGREGIDKLRLITNESLAEFVNIINSFNGDGMTHSIISI